jgi:hypothetical protein
MTSFEAGFVKYAKERGLPDQQAAYIFKRAMEHPGAQNMFKDLDEEDQRQTPDNLAALSDLLQQHLIHNDMSGAVEKIKI